MAKIIDNLTDSVNNNNQSFGSLDQNSQTLNTSLNQSSNNSQESNSFFKLPEILLEFVPFIPSLLEKATGQKIPGTISDLHLTIQQAIAGLQTVITNQQQIYQRITNLETNANSQLLNLDKRLENIQSIRLTHERERKQIEYNSNKNLESDYE